MKKYLAILLAAVMMLSCFAGCGDNNADPEQPSNPSDSSDPSNTPSDDQAAGPHIGPDGRVAREDQTYHSVYSSEMTTLNYLSTGTTYNLTVGANCIDPLVENDAYGNIVPCGATEWSSENEEYVDYDGETKVGQKWTFKIREGQHWYDKDGNEMGTVTAHDYVAGIRYVANAAYDCDNSYLVEGWVRGAEEAWAYTYAESVAVPKGEEVVDEENGNTEYVVDEAGVIYEVDWNDDDTIAGYTELLKVLPEEVMVEAVDDYTLVYHLTKPRPYFLTVMGFGCYWPAPAEMLETWGSNFGTDNTTMWFNGAYILSTMQPQQMRIYTKNENNWDAENIHIVSIEQTYNADSSSVAPNLYINGEIDGVDVDADLLTAWMADPEMSQQISRTRVSSDYSYFYGFNFEPRFDEEYEPENWAVAVNTENFRQAIKAGLNRQLLYQVGYPNNYNDLIMNTISPAGAYIYEGKDYVNYGDLAEITANDSFNEAKAVEYMKKAIPEIQAAGGHFPVIILVQYNGGTEWGTRCTLMQQTMHNLFNTDELKALTGGNDVIQIEINNFGSQGFLNGTRRAGNFCLQELNWGADYNDPETWADPFEVGNNYTFAYDTTADYGVNTKTAETAALDAEYQELVAIARATTDDMDARYEAFAKAEAFLINHAMVIPYGITGGGYQCTKMNGFEGQYATYGQATSRYKGQWIYETAMSDEMFEEQLAAWEANLAQ